MKLLRLTRVFHSQASPLISGKPLKRLAFGEASPHAEASVLMSICRKRQKIAGLVAMGLFAFMVNKAGAQSADDFFHSGARSYLTNNIPAAQKEVDQGLKLFPDDVKLKKLDELLKQKQQQQQQQNQQQQQQQQQKQDKSQQNQSKQNQSKQDQQQQSQQQKQNEQQKEQEQKQQEQKQAEQQKQPEQQGQGREMTPEEAKRLMDQEKADEMMLPATRKDKQRNSDRPLRDW